MKYRLLKDKIDSLGWYVNYKKAENVIECLGFADALLDFPTPQYIEILPDIVEEYVPSGIILFDDCGEEILQPKSGDFFFIYNKEARRMPGGIWEVREKPHFVHVSRRCVEPIE
jgi:hypothetical protein